MKESKGKRTQGAKEWKDPGTKGSMIGKEGKGDRNETQLRRVRKNGSRREWEGTMGTCWEGEGKGDEKQARR